MVMSGGCVIQLDRFHPRSWWRDVNETRATGIHCLGVMPAILLGLKSSAEETAHGVRYGTAANVEPQHHAAFEKRFGFPLVEGWAMTETGAGAAISADDEPRHLGTRCFGKPGADVELRIVDEAGSDVTEGTPGELLVRHAGANPKLGFFSGYLKDEAATEAGWAGGWWHTGDVVCRWEDGTLHFVDRRKNVIRRSGENISALEVEEMLRAHPMVAQVAVTGVADEVRGEEVMACIVPSKPAGEGDARAIFEWAMERTAYFKCPGWIAFVESLPTTATQKLQRGALRELGAGLLGAANCFDLRAAKRRTQAAQKESA
jgi:acyl-CoA synthetase (AMP-forming)/AMP-acid ligase II